MRAAGAWPVGDVPLARCAVGARRLRRMRAVGAWPVGDVPLPRCAVGARRLQHMCAAGAWPVGDVPLARCAVGARWLRHMCAAGVWPVGDVLLARCAVGVQQQVCGESVSCAAGQVQGRVVGACVVRGSLQVVFGLHGLVWFKLRCCTAGCSQSMQADRGCAASKCEGMWLF